MIITYFVIFPLLIALVSGYAYLLYSVKRRWLKNLLCGFGLFLAFGFFALCFWGAYEAGKFRTNPANAQVGRIWLREHKIYVKVLEVTDTTIKLENLETNEIKEISKTDWLNKKWPWSCEWTSKDYVYMLDPQ